MRSGALSAFFLGLLVLGGISLVFTDWNGMFRSGFGKTDLAIVDGTPIKIAEFNSHANAIMRQQNINPATAYETGVIDNILYGEIYNLLLKKNANSLGIRVEDRIIANQIKDLISPLKSGDISDKDALQKFLQMQGISEKQLTKTLRDDLTTKILKSIITGGTYIPKSLTTDILAHSNETRDLEVVFLPNSAITIAANPSDADLEKYYQGVAANFMSPEMRDITVATLDTSKIAKPVISDADIKAAYDDNQDKYMTAESATLDQTVVNDEKKAAEIATALKNSPSLAETVKALKGDEKSVQTAETYTQDGLPEELATPVFSGKAGDIIGPIKTALGYHVIKLTHREAAHVKSFESVKDSIHKELSDEKAGDAVFTVTSQIEDRLANGERFEDMKDEFHLNIITLKNLTKNSSTLKELDFAGNDAEKIFTKAFTVNEDAASELVDIGTKGILFSVRLDKQTQAAPKKLADVKEDVLRLWTADNQAQENILKAQKLADDINAGKVTLTSQKPTIIKALTRTESKDLAKDAVPRFMGADKGKVIMALSKDKNGIYIGRVTSVTLGKTDTKTADAARNNLEAELAQSSYTDYLASLQSKYKVTVNEDLIKQVYGTKTNEAE